MNQPPITWKERRDQWRAKQSELSTEQETQMAALWREYYPFIYSRAVSAAKKYRMEVDDMMHEAIWVWHDCCRKYSPEKGKFQHYLSLALKNQFHWAQERWNKNWKTGTILVSFDLESVGETYTAPENEDTCRWNRELVQDILSKKSVPEEALEHLREWYEEEPEAFDSISRLALASKEARHIAKLAIKTAKELQEITIADLRSILFTGYTSKRIRDKIEDAIQELREIFS